MAKKSADAINEIPEDMKDAFSQKQWDQMCSEDPSFKLFASSPWQDTYHNLVFSEDPSAESSVFTGEAKGSKVNWRTLQNRCYEKYRSFGPLNAAVNSKADYTAGAGFDLYSPNYEVNSFIRDLWYSHRNQMFSRVVGLVIRMISEGELFLLLSFNSDGKAKIRVLEPSRIGRGGNSGLILNPDDATETLFYKYKQEIIPDINIAYDPKKAKLVNDIVAANDSKLDNSRAKGVKNRNFRKHLGGFNRFVIHWKNLTGIMEYERDTSSLSTIIEAINLYWNAVKWNLDHKKAQAAYTNIFTFEDSPTGRLAFHMFKKMSPAEKTKSGLTGRLKPGSRVFCMPGMKFDVKNPQIQKMDGDNRDLLNLAGAGAQTPQDMFQGQSSDTSHSALKSSRSPLEKEIENLQYKLANFIKFTTLRSCFYVANKVGDFPAEFKSKAVDNSSGSRKVIDVKVEPCELVQIITPHVKFESDYAGKASAFLGNNHTGMISIGVTNKTAAASMGIKDYDRELDKSFLAKEIGDEPEPEPYNALATAVPKEAEKNIEEEGKIKKEGKDVKE